MRVKITKNLVTDDEKSFAIGSDIAFKYNGDDYIVEIADIGTKYFVGTNIEQNKVKVSGFMVFPIDKVTDCNYVYYD